MEQEAETLIGTFLYAASGKSFEVCRLVFTSRRMLVASLSWEEKSRVADSMNALFTLMTFPFTGPRINTDPLLIQRWIEIKGKMKDKQAVSYDQASALGVLGLGMAGRAEHGVPIIPYERIKRITVAESPMTKDYKVNISAGPLLSLVFLIPESTLEAFRELVGKTPLASRLLVQA